MPSISKNQGLTHPSTTNPVTLGNEVASSTFRLAIRGFFIIVMASRTNVVHRTSAGSQMTNRCFRPSSSQSRCGRNSWTPFASVSSTDRVVVPRVAVPIVKQQFATGRAVAVQHAFKPPHANQGLRKTMQLNPWQPIPLFPIRLRPDQRSSIKITESNTAWCEEQPSSPKRQNKSQRLRLKLAQARQ